MQFDRFSLALVLSLSVSLAARAQEEKPAEKTPVAVATGTVLAVDLGGGVGDETGFGCPLRVTGDGPAEFELRVLRLADGEAKQLSSMAITLTAPAEGQLVLVVRRTSEQVFLATWGVEFKGAGVTMRSRGLPRAMLEATRLWTLATAAGSHPPGEQSVLLAFGPAADGPPLEAKLDTLREASKTRGHIIAVTLTSQEPAEQ